MKGEIAAFTAYLRQERGRSVNTISSYQQDLLLACHLFNDAGINDWSAVDRFAIMNLITTMQKEGRAVASINRLLSSLRQFFRYLLQQEKITANPMDLIRQLPTKQEALVNPPAALRPEQVTKLINSIHSSTPLNGRDRALLILMYDTGMLVSELLALKMSQVHLDLSVIQFQPSQGQGRLIPLAQSSVLALTHYLQQDRAKLNANLTGDDPVFVNAHGRQLTRQGIWKIIRQRVHDAQLPANTTAQTFRHTFVTDLLSNGASWQGVQALLGQDPTPNQTYAHYLTMSSQELIALYHRYHTELSLEEGNA